MINLKNLIINLNDEVYSKVEGTLIKNKAENFLLLLRSYRTGKKSDREIIEALAIKSNSFYVLKSRLYDKIQEYLLTDIHTSKEETLRQLHQIPELCVSGSREVTTAFLLKLEKDLLFYDMHNELTVVYSALKSIHLYSEKYFHYSQLFNKHVAFSLSLEKSGEILGNFNRVLAQYHFSRSDRHLDTLIFLRKEISEHFTLNPSRRIENIMNVIEVQLRLFCETIFDTAASTESLLARIQKNIDEQPDSSPDKQLQPAIDFLFFTFYYHTGQKDQALAYFGKVDGNLSTLLLYTHICLTSNFLISKIRFLQEEKRTGELKGVADLKILHDPNDTHTMVLLELYRSMLLYYDGNYKEAVRNLNQVLNLNSFKDYVHINTEIKLTIVYFCILLKEYEMGENILKNISRKIKSLEDGSYPNVPDLIKAFSEDIKKRGIVGSKQKDQFMLFMARNTGSSKMLDHLVIELKKKYA